MTDIKARDRLRLHALHAVALVTLRACRPLRAKAIVDRTARLLRSSRTLRVDQAVRALFPMGTCLSRALAVAASVPAAEVVLGMDPWTAVRPRAHAWLEVRGERFDTVPDTSARLPGEVARFPSVEVS
jgi:hypothetical protein